MKQQTHHHKLCISQPAHHLLTQELNLTSEQIDEGKVCFVEDQLNGKAYIFYSKYVKCTLNFNEIKIWNYEMKNINTIKLLEDKITSHTMAHEFLKFIKVDEQKMVVKIGDIEIQCLRPG